MQWTVLNFPMGKIYLIGCSEGLIRCSLPTEKPGDEVAHLLKKAEYGTSLLTCHIQWFEQYFLRNFSNLDLPLLIFNGTEFQNKIWKVTSKVPAGEVRSYGQIAKDAGYPGAARAVGGAMAKNPLPILVPCHRIIKSDGSLGGFGGGLPLKHRLLRHESYRCD